MSGVRVLLVHTKFYIFFIYFFFTTKTQNKIEGGRLADPSGPIPNSLKGGGRGGMAALQEQPVKVKK